MVTFRDLFLIFQAWNEVDHQVVARCIINVFIHNRQLSQRHFLFSEMIKDAQHTSVLVIDCILLTTTRPFRRSEMERLRSIFKGDILRLWTKNEGGFIVRADPSMILELTGSLHLRLLNYSKQANKMKGSQSEMKENANGVRNWIGMDGILMLLFRIWLGKTMYGMHFHCLLQNFLENTDRIHSIQCKVPELWTCLQVFHENSSLQYIVWAERVVCKTSQWSIKERHSCSCCTWP